MIVKEGQGGDLITIQHLDTVALSIPFLDFVTRSGIQIAVKDDQGRDLKRIIQHLETLALGIHFSLFLNKLNIGSDWFSRNSINLAALSLSLVEGEVEEEDVGS